MKKKIARSSEVAGPCLLSKPQVTDFYHYGDPQVIRLEVVKVITGLSKSSVYSKMDTRSRYYDPEWPKSVKLGRRSVGWYRHEIMEWVESRAPSRGLEA